MILLDTVALIRVARGDRVERVAVERISAAEAEGRLCLSAISAWELCMLERSRDTGPLIGGDGALFLSRAREAAELMIVPVDDEIAIGSRRLPGEFHKDPADRFIIATARKMGATIVTTDGHMLDYARGGYVNALRC